MKRVCTPEKELLLLNAWLWKLGLPEVKELPKLDLKELARTEWSTKFEGYMRNRMIIGAFQYGKLHAKGKPKFDRLASIRSRLDRYEKDHNQEHLVDIANLCLLEFEEGGNELTHFTPQTTDEQVSRVKIKT